MYDPDNKENADVDNTPDDDGPTSTPAEVPKDVEVKEAA